MRHHCQHMVVLVLLSNQHQTCTSKDDANINKTISSDESQRRLYAGNLRAHDCASCSNTPAQPSAHKQPASNSQ